ncbi:MAG: hypothetical protein ACLU9X_02915 [Alistipes shahii]
MISTHQVREVENLIDKIVILDEQGLVLAATTEELSHRLTFGPLPADAKAIYSTPRSRAKRASPSIRPAGKAVRTSN